MTAIARILPTLAAICLIAASCGHRPSDLSRVALANRGLRLDGVISIAPNTPYPVLNGVTFGGVSGLVYDTARSELLGICDDNRHARVFRMRIRDEPFDVEPIGVISLETSGAPERLDTEGLVLLPDGHFLVSSEGSGSREPRVPPAIAEYSYDGRFVRELPLPSKFIPTPRGSQTSGVRDNEALESLTITRDGLHVFTGTESALVQDDEAASFERSARSRLIEYGRRGQGYVPIHEFAYEVDTIPRPSFAPGIAINGLVELLAIDARELLALERSYVEDASHRGRGVNRIRIYRVSLEHATDIAKLPSLRGQRIVTVSKTLLLDLGELAALPAALRRLDNFEGLALLPRRNGASSLLLVSDDNFSVTERTWFVRLEWRE
jgi:hypothetical protein